MNRTLALFLALAASLALGAGRRLTVTTNEGRELAGEVVMEAERGLLLKTAEGNVMVPWADIASSREEGAPAPRATTPAPAAQATPERQVLSLGLSAGLGASPIVVPGTAAIAGWYALDASIFMHFDFGRLAVRLAVPLQVGPWTRYGRAYFRLFSGLEGQLRFQFSPVVSSAIGLQTGVGVESGSSTQVGAFFAFGPTLTPIALRLGATRQHELSVQASVQLSSSSGGVGYAASLVSIKYGYLF